MNRQYLPTRCDDLSGSPPLGPGGPVGHGAGAVAAAAGHGAGVCGRLLLWPLFPGVGGERFAAGKGAVVGVGSGVCIAAHTTMIRLLVR